MECILKGYVRYGIQECNKCLCLTCLDKHSCDYWTLAERERFSCGNYNTCNGFIDWISLVKKTKGIHSNVRV